VVSQFQRIARTLNLVVVAGFACPYAHGEPAGSTPPSAVPTPQAKSAPDSATVQGADSRINTAEIVKRVNKELGINLEATTASWQRGLGPVGIQDSHPGLVVIQALDGPFRFE
jgi:potassium-dependent mechanosensitive channel